MAPTVYNNGVVAVMKNLVFGWSVYSENGWCSITECDLKTLRYIWQNTSQPIYPPEFREELNAEIVKLEKETEHDETV